MIHSDKAIAGFKRVFLYRLKDEVIAASNEDVLSKKDMIETVELLLKWLTEDDNGKA